MDIIPEQTGHKRSIFRAYYDHLLCLPAFKKIFSEQNLLDGVYRIYDVFFRRDDSDVPCRQTAWSDEFYLVSCAAASD